MFLAFPTNVKQQEGKCAAIKTLGRGCKIFEAESTLQTTSSWNKEQASLKCDKVVFIVTKSRDKKNSQNNKRTRKGILAQALKEIKQVLYVMV